MQPAQPACILMSTDQTASKYSIGSSLLQPPFDIHMKTFTAKCSNYPDCIAQGLAAKWSLQHLRLSSSHLLVHVQYPLCTCRNPKLLDGALTHYYSSSHQNLGLLQSVVTALYHCSKRKGEREGKKNKCEHRGGERAPLWGRSWLNIKVHALEFIIGWLHRECSGTIWFSHFCDMHTICTSTLDKHGILLYTVKFKHNLHVCVLKEYTRFILATINEVLSF